MSYQIVITSAKGEIADTIAVVNGTSVAVAPGENVALFDETGAPAKFDFQFIRGDSLVTFENGDWVTLVDYALGSPQENSDVSSVVEFAKTDANSHEDKLPLPSDASNPQESEKPVAAMQNAPTPISFGGDVNQNSGDTDVPNSIVGAISSIPDFSLIRGFSVTGTSFDGIESRDRDSSEDKEDSGSVLQNLTDETDQLSQNELTDEEENLVSISSLTAPTFRGTSNLAPVANDDLSETTQSGLVRIPILENDYDPDGGKDFDVLIQNIPITAGGDSITLKSGAIVTLTAEGILEYIPGDPFISIPADGTAIDTFAYTIVDQEGGSDSATVSVQINGENDLPVAEDDSATMNDNGAPLSVAVLANDRDPDGDALAILDVIQPDSGATVTSNDDGTLTYDPGSIFDGLGQGESTSDSFSYVVDDGHGGNDSAIVSIIVHGVNDNPTVTPDTAPVLENGTINIPVIENDTDPNGDDLCVSHINGIEISPGDSITLISGAILTLRPDFSIDYDSTTAFDSLQAGITATDSFEYTLCDEHGASATSTVTVDVEGTNDAPVAVEDEADVGQNDAVDINVLLNDYDPDNGDTISVKSVSLTGTKGAISIDSNDIVTFSTAGDFTNLAKGETEIIEFNYVIEDQLGETGTAAIASQITVEGSNDDPSAGDDSATTSSGTSIEIDVLGNDSDPDTIDKLNVSEVTQGASGADVSIDDNGNIIYDPGSIFNGVSDGSTATDTFSYTISDGNGGTTTATVSVTIEGTNVAPESNDDSASAFENEIISISALGNDSDANGDDISITDVDQPSSGAIVTIKDNGDLSYNPNGKFDHLAGDETEVDTFVYRLEDEFGNASNANVTITIQGVNNAPTLTDDTARTDEETPINLDLTSNDSDSEGDSLSITEINGTPVEEDTPFDLPSGGIVTLNSNGTLTFDPASGHDSVALGETGVETFEYTVSDGNGGSSVGEVNITIDGVNDAPVAVDDAPFEAFEDGPSAFYDITPDTPGQDFDPEGGDVSVVGINGTLHNDGDKVLLPSGAYVIMNADGNIEYNANDAFHAELDFSESLVDSINYTISDSLGATDTATFQVTVIGQNDALIANDDCSFGNTPGSGALITPIGNDVDIDGFIDQATMSIGGIDLDPANDGIQTEYIVPGQGTWTLNPDFTVSFEPAPELNGDPDPVYYAVADNRGLYGEPAAIEVSYFTADIWFANDLSGSVTEDEYLASLNLIADAAQEVEFGSGLMGNQAAMISWAGEGEQNLDVELTSDKNAFIDSVKADPRSFVGYTDLGGAINYSLDSIADPANGSRQPNGVPQVLTIMTDISPDQLYNRPPYDDERYSQNQIAEIEAASERAAALGVTLVFIPIEDAAASEEAVSFFQEVASKDPAGNPLVYPAGNYDDIDTDTVAGVVEALRLASAPSGHGSCIAGTPITVDLNNDGFIEYSSIDDGFRYDIDGDGQTEQTSWVGNDDALLVYDKDQNGEISNRAEFILSDWTKADDTDLEAIAAFFDSNQDGRFDENDSAFDQFALWRDSNGNAQVDDGEWTTLLDAGVIGFDVQGDGQYSIHADGDVQVSGNTTFQMKDGSSRLAHDAAFQFANTPDLDEMLTSPPSDEGMPATTASGEIIEIDTSSDSSSASGQTDILASPIQPAGTGDAGINPSGLDEEVATATAIAAVQSS